VNELLNDRYQIERILGEGALGRTMLATDVDSSAQVAVKELLPSRMKRWKDYDLFHRECRTLRTLNHRGIPAYHDDFVIESEDPSTPSRLFLVQEYIDGDELQELLDAGEEFDEERVRQIARDVLDILDYLHTLNPPVIHRDLKPANLILGKDGRVRLIDFGAVREAITADGVGSTIVGTFGYMPPEQYAGGSCAATDLFALGATCVQLLTRRPPGELFDGLHEFRIPDDLPVTLGFERLLLKLTEPEVELRYQSASEVLDELNQGFLMVPREAITGALPIPHEIVPAPRPPPGFHLRDAYHGFSHLAVVLLASMGIVLSFAFPVAALTSTQPAWAFVGFFGTVMTGAMAAAVSKKARNEISVYRGGTYALGEVTGRFLSTSSAAGTHLTYRYRIADGTYQHGCIATVDKAYRELCPGDPVGVIYLPDEPSEHVMYAVPADWSRGANASVNKRLLSSDA
jgi:hypothetical protein